METTYRSPLALCMKEKYGYTDDMGVIGQLLGSNKKAKQTGLKKLKKYGFSDEKIESIIVDLKVLDDKQKEVQRRESERRNKIYKMQESVAHMIEDIPISNVNYYRSIAMTKYNKKSAGMSFEKFMEHLKKEQSHPGVFVDKETGAEYHQDSHDNSYWHNTDWDCVGEVLGRITSYIIDEIGIEVDFYPEPENEHAEVIAYMLAAELDGSEIEYLTLKFLWMYHDQGHIKDFLPGGQHHKKGIDFTCYGTDALYPTTEEDLEVLREKEKNK